MAGDVARMPAWVWAVGGGLAVVAIVGIWGWTSTRTALQAARSEAAAVGTRLDGEIKALGTRLATDETEGRARGLSLSAAEAKVTELTGALDTERQAHGELAALRTKIDDGTALLNQRMATLGAREKEIAAAETRLGQHKTALAAGEAGMGEAGARLSRRMATLGEREREQIDLDRRIGEAKAQAEAAQKRAADVEQRINARMHLLGEREQEFAKIDRETVDARARLATLQGEITTAGERLTMVRRDLGQAEDVLAAKRRDAQTLGTAVERARQLLGQAQ